MARRVALLGGVLIVAGLLVAGVQTGGFDQVDADRGVSVDVAPQNASYLAIQDSYAGGSVLRYCFFRCNSQRQNVLSKIGTSRTTREFKSK